MERRDAGPVRETPDVDVAPGETFALGVGPVSKQVGGTTLQLLAYNGSIPGPRLRVRQGTEIFVDVVNDTDADTTVHWHGLRLDNAYDGVPYATQAPIPPGASYTHRLTFPDPGLYWYHPHVREDYAQELGLYGNIVVEPSDAAYWPPADREVVLTLDDILIADGAVAPFDAQVPNFVAMGRYGNTLLIGGEIQQHVDVAQGEVVRLLLTNTANTRVFNVVLPGRQMKLVGGDGGRVEREEWVESVVLAPSERAIVDIGFFEAGAATLQHQTPERAYPLVTFTVAESRAATPAAAAFSTLRENPEMVAERDRSSAFLDSPPGKTLAIVAEMDVAEPNAGEVVSYACPMHPEVVRNEPGTCPKCGMKLLPQTATAAAMDLGVMEHGAMEPGAMEPGAMEHGDAGMQHHDHGGAGDDGIEWEDQMLDVNRSTTTANMRWIVVDRDSGKANTEIDWTFARGAQVKVRLVNEMQSDHPMHHPFHVHGERFLVLSRDGVAEPNLVWKDTVLIRTGQTVDLLLDASNPGLWMAHCHIPEHMAAGMMFSFRVE